MSVDAVRSIQMLEEAKSPSDFKINAESTNFLIAQAAERSEVVAEVLEHEIKLRKAIEKMLDNLLGAIAESVQDQKSNGKKLEVKELHEKLLSFLKHQFLLWQTTIETCDKLC